jgi:prepilin-type N-terminal cleavage/methylation domain-containing protein
MFDHDAHDASKRRRENGRAMKHVEAGFSLAELLAVLALVGIVLALGLPLMNEQIRIAEVRSAADQVAVHLRAARMIAVSHHKDIVVTVSADPVNTLSYEGTNGDTKLIAMPGRVKITTGSTALITFHSDGSSGASSTVTTESAVSSATERWTLTVNTVGMVTVAHARV